ncbi:MAG TPA: hypothetical protein DCQ06_03020 [Myxococcales bacterium]|nr:hypothetical protein [Myxococcales bacterium]
MNIGRWLLGLIFGVGVTALQFMAVGVLNGANMPLASKDKKSSTAAAPIIVKPTPRTVVTAPQRRSRVRTRAARPVAAVAQTRQSMLPAAAGGAAQAGSLAVLSGLGDVGLQDVAIPDVSSEPDQPARVLRAVRPVYPMSAQRDGVEGYVVVRLTIDARGRVTDVLVVDSQPIGVFERSARHAARRLEFHPAKVGGAASAATLEKTIRFSLQ